jgi:hypothetical protein
MRIGFTKIIYSRNFITITIFFFVILLLFTLFLPPAVDWSKYFRPAAIEFINGRSPYSVEGFINPPWVLLPMLPLLLLPESLSRAILALGMMISLVFVSKKMGANLVSSVILLLSPPVIQLFIDGNIDWIVALGFILPPQIGLFFIALKPQLGLFLAIYWLISAWRSGGIREVFRVFTPFLLVLVATFLVYGFYPLNHVEHLAWGGNTSLWPISIPIGLALFVHSLRKNDQNFSILASPCFSPYLILHSWVGVLLVLSRHKWEFAVSVIGLWIVVVIRAFNL